ncbi:RluA family pseudouridine synthase [Geobacter sp. DSM 9736]|uniref:RluA family pseudouridine synthase n=1 Tax=Geobacter sp. DSM 9736 TaxID=1277350 RepID=UPI000B504221|nr:RluA family pseudouridine synthase [Geobacter sp. DSM 9736]SNB47761.1 ribosomal large subunit pseudouridine synthase D [Geobacter sp. DSM 9736]
MEKLQLKYEAGEETERLDQFVARMVENLTRSAATRLIETGFVTVNGMVQKPSLKLKGGELIDVTIPPPAPAEAVAEEIPLEILHEDSDVVVINKPAGMTVHPGAGRNTGTLVNALLGHCDDLSGIGGELRPGIVHRIDKDTSGILVVAKNDAAHRSLAEQFREHTVKRVYLALVFGSPRQDKGRIESAIGRHPVERKKMSGKARHGRNAVTHWRVLARYRGITLMSLRLETGRTHQIRVHLSEAGYPLVGDEVYGGTSRLGNIQDPLLRKMVKQLGRQALHAATLGFIHPSDASYREFTTDMPEDMARVLRYLQEQAQAAAGTESPLS